MTEYKPGLMAGVISGLVWAGLMSVTSVASIELSYSQIYNQLASNSSALGGLTPAQYINNLIETNTAITFILSLAFGALIGFIFVYVSPKFLGNRSYMIKGVVVAFFFWLLYELGLVGFVDPLEILSSLAISLLAGYLLGSLYQRFTSSRGVVFPSQPDSMSGQNSTQPSSRDQP
jgi:lipopolysaccharide export LptBFGC system permease protein LptF